MALPWEPQTLNSVWDETRSAFGWASVSCNTGTGHWYDWDLYNNVYTTQNFNANERRSVAGHEWGHALGLDDDNPGSGSLMDQSRDRNTIYVPQVDDRSGINAQYNHAH